MLEAETLAEAAAGTAIAVGYPSPEQSRMLSPVAPACVAQDDVEPLLLEPPARAAPAPRVELGIEVTGVWSAGTARASTLRDVTTGALRTVHARYVVAADGARSTVRARARHPAARPEDDVMAGFTTLFRAPLWDVVGEHRHLLYSVTHPAAPASSSPPARRTAGCSASRSRRAAAGRPRGPRS